MSCFVRSSGDERLERLSTAHFGVEGPMTNFGRLVIGCVTVILMTAINVGMTGSAIAQSRMGEIGRDVLTNRHDPPSSETEFPLWLDM